MKRIKVIALMESQTVTGPAKNLIEFAKMASQPEGDFPGIEILITTFHRRDAREDFINAVRGAGLPIAVISEKRAFDRTILPKLRQTVSDYAPDIIQTHNVKSHFLVKWLGLHRLCPWIAFHHGFTTTDLKMRVYNQLNRYSLRSADQVVTVCRAFSSELIGMGVRPERIVVQHNSIKPFVSTATSELEALRRSLGVEPGARLILNVGRLSREKGHRDLIRAFASLHENSPEIILRLVLVGDGPEHQAIRRLSLELSVKDLIIFAGHQRDVSAFYAISDVFILPSHSEGSPNVLLEAMAAGVPSVATSVGGVPEIAENEINALLVERGDFVGMARGIERLLRDVALRERLIENGGKITQRYAPNIYRHNIVQIYTRLLNK